jgi:predicted transcriptional regulator
MSSVHESSGDSAAHNREDMVHSNAFIILSSFISFGNIKSPFANLACKIMSQLVKVGDAVLYASRAGVPRACVRYLKQLKVVESVARASQAKVRRELAAKERAAVADRVSIPNSYRINDIDTARSRLSFNSNQSRPATPVSAREAVYRVQDEVRMCSSALEEIKTQQIECANIIKGLATHAAGLFCARQGFSHTKTVKDDRFVGILKIFGR